MGTKGLKTEQRILDVATKNFALNGFSSTSLRDIAKEVGIEVPGLYKYFSSKQKLYDATLEHSLMPIKEKLSRASMMDNGNEIATLPSDIIDIFTENPAVAALFYQCLTSSSTNKSMANWLDEFLISGTAIMKRVSLNQLTDADAAIMMMNVFHLCTGYFMSAELAKRNWQISIYDKELLEKQKAMINHFLTASLKQNSRS